MSRQKDYIFQGAFLWLNGKGEVTPYVPSKLMMVEDINDYSRTWVLDFLDDQGTNEFIGLWKKQEDQTFLYGNHNSPQDALNVCVVRIQDVKVKNIYTEDTKYKGIRVKCVEVFDNFLSVGFKTKKAYKNKTAQDIFKDVFSTLEGGFNIEAPDYGNPINIPLLLNPYWTKRKLLKYVMDNYVFGGPGKMIISYENEGSKISKVNVGMYPLQYIMLGLYGIGKPLKVEPDDTYTNGIKTDYYIHGPSRADRVYKDYKDQGLYVFNDMKGIEPNALDMDDFVGNEIGPLFDDNSERGYTNPFFTTVSKNAEVTPKLGDILHEKDTERGISTTNMKLDCEPKPIVQHKVLSRFYQYQTQNFVMECTVAPSPNLKLGYRYHIRLPSRNQQNSVGIADETLSGNWVLSRIEHDLYQNGDRYEYRPRCFFIRTGLENAPDGGPPAQKATDKSLEEKKVKANKSPSDKISNAKSDAQAKIKDAKKGVTDKVAGATEKATSVVSGSLDKVKGSIGADNLSSGASSIADKAKGLASSAGAGLSNIASSATGAVSGIASNVGAGLGAVGKKIGTSISSVSTKLVGGKAGVAGFAPLSNIVSKAKDANLTKLASSSGNVKLIDGTMEIDGVTGRVNGLVKGGMKGGVVSGGNMLANFNDGSGNKILEGKIDGAYDEETTSVSASFDGDVISDRTDEQITESVRVGDPVAERWLV